MPGFTRPAHLAIKNIPLEKYSPQIRAQFAAAVLARGIIQIIRGIRLFRILEKYSRAIRGRFAADFLGGIFRGNSLARELFGDFPELSYIRLRAGGDGLVSNVGNIHSEKCNERVCTIHLNV
jgi:hypothetical protein